PGQVGTSARPRARGSKPISSPQDRPQVAGIGYVPKSKRERLDPAPQRLPPVDANHARRMGHRRDLRQQLGLDIFSGAEELDRLEARVVGGLDEMLALSHEQAFLFA